MHVPMFFNRTVSRLREYLQRHPQCRFVITEAGTKLHFADAEHYCHSDFYDRFVGDGPKYDRDRHTAIHGYVELKDGQVRFRRFVSNVVSSVIVDKFIERGFVQTFERLSFEW